MTLAKSNKKKQYFPCKAARRYHNAGGKGKFQWAGRSKACFTESYSINGTEYTIEIISTGFGDKAIAKVKSDHIVPKNETGNGMDEQGHIILDFKQLRDGELETPQLDKSQTDIIDTWHRARFWCWAKENNCDPSNEAAWIFFKNSDPSGREHYDWSYDRSQFYERFHETISVGGYYNFTIKYLSSQCGKYSLSYCHDGVDYIEDNGDGHLYKSGIICLGDHIEANCGVMDAGRDLEWVIHRTRYWAVAFAYWCEYGNWIDP